MFKLAVFFALVAAAFAAPQLLFRSGLPLTTYPSFAYNAPLAVSAPVAYSAPAPYAYNTEPLISYAAEPVEQHGYRIAY